MAGQAPALPRQPRTPRTSLVGPSPLARANEDSNAMFVARAPSVRNIPTPRFYNLVFPSSHRDQLENNLRSEARQNGKVRSFLKDYARLKNTQDREVFDGLLRYWVFNSSSSVPSLYPNGLVLESTKPSFSKFIDGLRIALRSGETGCLRLCLMTETLPQNAINNLYSFGAKMVVPMNRLSRCPTRAMLYTIMQEWDKIKAAQAWLDPKEPVWATRIIKLPSTDTARKPFHVNASGAAFELRWLSQAPEYRTDFYEYVWQRQNHPPVFSTATVEFQTTAKGSRNVFVILSSPGHGSTRAGLLARFEQAHKDLSPSISARASCSREERFVTILLSVFDLMIQDTTVFADQLSQEIARLAPLGRKNPSGSKLHFLSHLGDYRKYSITSLQSSITILDEVINGITNQPLIGQDLLLPVSKMRADIGYLETELDVMERDLYQLYAMLKDKLELRQIRRTYILTFLAAIYLPFSFMTSLYGMNLQDPLWGSTKLSSIDVSSNSITSVDSSNNTSSFDQTEVSNIATAIKDSGPHL